MPSRGPDLISDVARAAGRNSNPWKVKAVLSRDLQIEFRVVYDRAFRDGGLGAAIEAVARAGAVARDRILRGQPEVEIVAESFGVTANAIMGKSRVSRVADARHVLAWVLRMSYRMTYPEIGTILDRDHTTIISAVRKVEGDERLLSLGLAIRDQIEAAKATAVDGLGKEAA